MEATSKQQDVLIIGGGPAGTCTAMFLKKFYGIQSLIVEKERFPRYHIGESFTGETGGQLRKIDMEHALDGFEYPIKIGTKVWGTGGRNSFYIPVMARINGELTAVTTWQARRSDFDKLLMDTALSRGIDLFDGEAVTPLLEAKKVTGVRCRSKEGTEVDIKARVVVDASGQGTFLANRGVIGPKDRGNYDKQVAIFSQVKGAIRDEGPEKDNTLIFYQKKNHWAWFIPLDKEAVSIGVVTPSDYFTSCKESKLDFLKREMLSLNPELTKRVQNIEFVEETRGISNYSYWIPKFVGDGFLCVGDSHRFIDPIFSLGLLFATKESEFAACAIHDYFSGKAANPHDPFLEYETYVDKGQGIIQTMLDCFWEYPLPFLKYAHQTHRGQVIDMFAGRIYGEEVQQYEVVLKMRELLTIKGMHPAKQQTAV
ncbi:MAG TPA: NAD(P)/FAD-dependent oxidoreductase [Terriglobales bacterium]|jgi:flavin-dependent dehydrogenase